MDDELEFEVYLSISPDKFGIYLFNPKKNENFYNQELTFKSLNNSLDLLTLSKFLEDNIFKIEKLIGKFVKNIHLIINSTKLINLSMGIKKKNYHEIINKKYLENLLTDANDLVKETYQDKKIIHVIIKSFLIDGKYYSKFINEIDCNTLCLEVEFILIPNSLILEIEKVLKKYQIKIIKYLDEIYVKNIFDGDNIEISKIANKIKNGFNDNEVNIVPKITNKMGFFEKFFQLFS